jgi:hypothetical protein
MRTFEYYEKKHSVLVDKMEDAIWDVVDIASIKEVRVSEKFFDYICRNSSHPHNPTYRSYLKFAGIIPIVMDVNEVNYSILFKWRTKKE